MPAMETTLPELSYARIVFYVVLLFLILRFISGKIGKLAPFIKKQPQVALSVKVRASGGLFDILAVLYLGLVPIESSIGRTEIVGVIAALLAVAMLRAIVIAYCDLEQAPHNHTSAISKLSRPLLLSIVRLGKGAFALAKICIFGAIAYFKIDIFFWSLETGPTYTGALFWAVFLASDPPWMAKRNSEPDQLDANGSDNDSTDESGPPQYFLFLIVLTILGIRFLESAAGQTTIGNAISALLAIAMLGALLKSYDTAQPLSENPSLTIRLGRALLLWIARLRTAALTMAIFGTLGAMAFYKVRVFTSASWIYEDGTTYTGILIAAILLAWVPRLAIMVFGKRQKPEGKGSDPVSTHQSGTLEGGLFFVLPLILGFAPLENSLGQSTLVTALFVILVVVLLGATILEYYNIDKAPPKSASAISRAAYPILILFSGLAMVAWIIAALGFIAALIIAAAAWIIFAALGIIGALVL